MAANRGLTSRLGRELVLQGLYISVAALVGVFAVFILFEDVLIKEALRGEAEYYWERYANEADAALPNTRNMTGYRDKVGLGLPPALVGLAPGFYPQQDPEAIAYISEHNNERLYLVFDNVRVGNLVLLFGLLPLALVLIVIYLALFSAYRVSRRAVSPVIQLADQVQQWDPAVPETASFTFDDAASSNNDEVAVLATAMQEMTQRLAAFTERERNFTRDASHELRSPLTVIKMAATNLRNQAGLDSTGLKNLDRIVKSSDDMEELTQAFLLLARESGEELDSQSSSDEVCVNAVVADEIERTELLAANKKISMHWHAGCQLYVQAPEKVIASVIGNLVRNALSYTDQGSVRATISDSQVLIEDTGPGMAQSDVENLFKPFYRGQRRPGGRQRGGHGVGLTIVKRLSDRFGWPVRIDSALDAGTRVTVRFPGARCEALQTTPSSQDLHTPKT